MFIELPDPNPGRCINIRQGDRCLDYDFHEGRCRFPEKDPSHELYWQTMTRGWQLNPEPPKKWVSPLEGTDDGTN